MDRPPIPQHGDRPRRIEHPLHPRLRRMRMIGKLLDNSILLPGGYRIGLDPLMGLIPGIGDVLASTFSVWIIYDAARLGISKWMLLRMVGNVLLEVLAGAIPVLGDLFDAAWKANARNVRLVEREYHPGLPPRSLGQLLSILLVVLLLIYGCLFGVLYLLFSMFSALLS